MASQPVALVTGASSGIGQATAELLAARGFTVFGTSRVPSREKRSYSWLALDVRSDASVEAAVKSLLEQAGRIDVLVNNAGYALVGAVEETSLADAQAQLETNLFGVLRMVKAVLPTMRQQGSGRIINISSVVGHVAPPYAGLYATSKFALEGLSEALFEEVRPFGITVSLIAPGFVKTSIVSEQAATPLAAYAAGRQAATQILRTNVQKGMEPRAVAEAVLRAATRRPRLRYSVGSGAWALILFKRLLPEGVFESQKRRIFKLDQPLTPQAEPAAQNAAVTH